MWVALEVAVNGLAADWDTSLQTESMITINIVNNNDKFDSMKLPVHIIIVADCCYTSSFYELLILAGSPSGLSLHLQQSHTFCLIRLSLRYPFLVFPVFPFAYCFFSSKIEQVTWFLSSTLDTQGSCRGAESQMCHWLYSKSSVSNFCSFFIPLPSQAGKQRYSVLDLSLRASFSPFVHLLPNLWMQYFDNELTDFDTSWFKWSMEQGHKTFHFGGQEVKIVWGGLARASL